MRTRVMSYEHRDWLLHAVVVIVALVLAAAIGTPSAKAQGTGNSSSLGIEGLYYELVISTMRLRADNPAIGQTEAFSNHYFAALRSAFIGLDGSKSARALEFVSKLSAYEMGASVVPLYDCLVLRKGKAIKAHLKKVLSMGEKACDPQVVGKQCLNNENLRIRISSLIKDIDAVMQCDVPLIPAGNPAGNK